MKIVHLNRSDVGGGAARAVYRVHHALRNINVDSTMYVNHAGTDDWTVISPQKKSEKLLIRVRQEMANQFSKVFRSANKITHSSAIFGSNLVGMLNRSDYDIIHLHWVMDGMISISDISKIKKPIVWTFHDMWPFCGAEHIAWDKRWKEGYRYDNRPIHESGFDLNRWTWERKRKYWKQPFKIVTPSNWMAKCVQQSSLMSGWPVNVVPNCLDTNIWRPIKKSLARDLHSLPKDVPLIMFGSNGINSAHHKGYDLLIGALNKLSGKIKDMELVIFGEIAPKVPPNFRFPVRYVGHLHDDLSLTTLYSSVDALVVPSRVESFCQTASEAQSCGTPVVAFQTGGLLDIVEHQVTGYLAKAFDISDLAEGILWVLYRDLRQKSRKRAVKKFSNDVVAEQYKLVYEKALEDV